MTKAEIKKEILGQLDEACGRLKKRIEHLTVEANAIVINPYNLRMVAEAPNGDLYVACNLNRRTESEVISIGFCYAPLAQVLDILTFTPDNQDTLDAVQRDFAARAEACRLANIRFISYREFCGKLAEVLKQGLTETEQTINNIKTNDDGEPDTGNDVQPIAGPIQPDGAQKTV